jgi:hypothetical protein
MKIYGENGGIAPTFLTTCEWSAWRSYRITPLPRKISPGIHLTGGWVGLEANLDAVEKRKKSYSCRESNLVCLGPFLLFLFCLWSYWHSAATPGLLCQPRVIVKMIVEKQMECRLAGETEVSRPLIISRTPMCTSTHRLSTESAESPASFCSIFQATFATDKKST